MINYYCSGVAFVENGSKFFSLILLYLIYNLIYIFLAMNRAYTEADKMILIARHYYVLNISQTLAIIGAFLFMILVIIPTWTSNNYIYFLLHYSNCNIFFSL